MKRLLAFTVGAFGLRALLRRRRGGPPPADALRDKLAARRADAPPTPPAAATPEREPAPEPEPAAEEEASDVDARRADVHARARRQIDELSGS